MSSMNSYYMAVVLIITLIDKIRKRRLTCFGHVTRMEVSRLPAVAPYGQVEGTRSKGRQSKKWTDNYNVKEDIAAQVMNTREAERTLTSRTVRSATSEERFDALILL